MRLRSVAPALVGVALLASVGHSTVRCRSADGRIYIGPEPPAGCEVEATYGSTSSTVAPDPTQAPTPATMIRPREPSPPSARASSPRVAVPASPPAEHPREATERDGPSSRPATATPTALASKRTRLERALDRVIFELEGVERAIVDRNEPRGRESSPEAARVRLRRDAERRQELEPLRRRQGELRAERDRIRAEFAELTSRVAVANGGSLPGWWPAELRCGRCP